MINFKLISLFICFKFYCSNIVCARINEPTNNINIKTSPEVTVVFETYFKNDSVSLWINNNLIFSERIKTDYSTGASEFVYFKQPRGKTFLLAAEVNGCRVLKQVKKNVKFVYINYESSKCEVIIETSNKLRSYF